MNTSRDPDAVCQSYAVDSVSVHRPAQSDFCKNVEILYQRLLKTLGKVACTLGKVQTQLAHGPMHIGLRPVISDFVSDVPLKMAG